MPSIVLDPGHTRDTKGLHLVGDFLESAWCDRHTFNETIQYAKYTSIQYTDAKTVIYIYFI